ncbi:hypothetical protein AN958_12451 [Leucoagaricus sp. SymC.cos]|nr:hypothetical protein AN958_12451 [Leucoagaricus sp. SymC.cos]
MSSIPGLGSITATAAVSPPLVSSWIDSMGKKLDQLQKSSAFTQNQKRASTLLSDMSNSITSALASSTSSATPGGAVNVGKSSSSLMAPSASPNPSSSGSLLDDEDEDETAKLGSSVVLQPVANPSPVIPPALKRVETKTKEKEKKKMDFDDEEWNW